MITKFPLFYPHMDNTHNASSKELEKPTGPYNKTN